MRPRSSKQARLAQYLMGGGRYSVGDIMNALHIGDPRSVIRDLRERGIVVNDEWYPTGDGGRYKRYWIDRNEG